MTPSQRSRAYLRSQGYACGSVERFVRAGPKGGFRRDLFNIIDVIAIRPGEIMGVQSTGTDFAGHLRKLTIDERDSTISWLRSGGALRLIGWRKLKSGWAPRIKDFNLSEFSADAFNLDAFLG